MSLKISKRYSIDELMDMGLIFDHSVGSDFEIYRTADGRRKHAFKSYSKDNLLYIGRHDNEPVPKT